MRVPLSMKINVFYKQALANLQIYGLKPNLKSRRDEIIVGKYTYDALDSNKSMKEVCVTNMTHILINRRGYVKVFLLAMVSLYQTKVNELKLPLDTSLG